MESNTIRRTELGEIHKEKLQQIFYNHYLGFIEKLAGDEDESVRVSLTEVPPIELLLTAPPQLVA